MPEPLRPVASEALRMADEAEQERASQARVAYEPPAIIDGPTGTWTLVLDGVTEAEAREVEAEVREMVGQRAHMYKGDPMKAAVAHRMRR